MKILFCILFLLPFSLALAEDYTLSISTVTFDIGVVCECQPLFNMLEWEKSYLGYYEGDDRWGCRIYTYPNYFNHFVKDKWLNKQGNDLNHFKLISKCWSNLPVSDAVAKPYILKENQMGIPLEFLAEIIKEVWLKE